MPPLCLAREWGVARDGPAGDGTAAAGPVRGLGGLLRIRIKMLTTPGIWAKVERLGRESTAMEFGIQFFPDIGPKVKPADVYFDECLRLVDLTDELLYTHIRTVEHYFEDYGGYSPNPIVFLTAAVMRNRKARLITGAVLPVFNNPLKLAGEIGMLDAISGGRLEVGFARAFLPHEFRRFGVSPDESRERFAEGMEQVRLLLEGENVSHQGRFHR